MKKCAMFGELRQFGINFLTGEADALGYRVLCDLNGQGKKVFCECFGIPDGARLAEGWNDGVASVMLTEHDIVPLAIMGFYLQGYHKVILTESEKGDDRVYALEDGEDIVLDDKGGRYLCVQNDHTAEWPVRLYGKVTRIIRQQKSDGKIVQGTRNVHQFTGRVS